MKKWGKWFDLFFFLYWSARLIEYMATGSIAPVHIMCSLALTAHAFLFLFLEHLTKEA